MAIQTNFPAARPSLLLDFANTKKLDPRITFTRSTTATYYDGVTGTLQTAAAGVARFDHNPVTRESLGLLIEEQRSNLFTYSADFSNASWLKTRSGVTPNTVIAPDGTLTGDYFYANGTGVPYLYKQITLTQNQPYTMSCFVKQGDLPTPRVMLRDFTEAGNVVFDIVSGTISTAASGICSNASIVNVGNGWFRISAVFTPTIATGNHNISPVHIDNVAGTIFGFYCWGAQLEAGAFATSYIPTVASSATRNADVANIAGSNFTSWFNVAEGTLYCDWVKNGTSSFQAMAIISDGVNSPYNNIALTHGSGSPNNARFDVNLSSTTQASLTLITASVIGTAYKTIGTYKTNDFAGAVNAETIQTDTSGNLPIVNQLGIGNNTIGGGYLNGTIKKLAYYRKRLTNSQLQNLTS